MDEKERLLIWRRLNSFFGIILVFLGVLVLRLAQLQIIQGESWKVKAVSYRQDEMIIPAARGQIYDRNGRLLVTNQASFSLYFSPLDLPKGDYERMAKKISEAAHISQSEVWRKMDAVPPFHVRQSQPRCLMIGLSPKQVAYFSEHQSELNGVRIVAEPRRKYVQGSLASHLIGYLNSIPEKSVQKFQKLGYRADERVGVFGVEHAYESQLHGQDGLIRVKMNRQHQPVAEEVARLPVKGNDLILCIDSKLQAQMEQALADQIRAINSNPKLKRVSNAMAVAMNPNNGEVLAMASYPSFDPNWWVNGIDETIYREKFVPAEMNRALQQTVAPGSTIKPATVLLGLDRHIIAPWTTFRDDGRLQVGWNQGKPYYLYCWDHNGHGVVDIKKALAVSCNVYMYNLSLKLGGWSNLITDSNYWITNHLPRAAQQFDEYYKQFGLGKSTGIDLDEEETGNMGKAVYLADLPFIAIGQHQAYTAVQLAQYVSVLANGGKRIEPHVVKEIRSTDGRVVRVALPRVLNTVQLPETYLSLVQAGMQDVVSKPYGTAYATFQGARYTVSGKTGTAETGVSEDNALFIGYAPSVRPEIAISVIVPGGGHGSDSSVPIARKIFDAYFAQASAQGQETSPSTAKKYW